MKFLLKTITDLLLRSTRAKGEHWTQCEFQFPRRIREKATRTVFDNDRSIKSFYGIGIPSNFQHIPQR